MDAAYSYTEFVSVSAVTMALVQISKQLKWKLDSRYLPYLAIIVAAAVNALAGIVQAGFDFQQFDFASSMVSGITSGFGAMGGYDFIQALFKKKQEV
jgi:small basic protein